MIIAGSIAPGRSCLGCFLRGWRSARGFTLIEASVSVLIVGGMMIAAVSTVGAFKSSQNKIVTRARARLLAQGLMAEILSLDYEEPVDTPVFGRESSENGGDRAEWDDVDDYHGWTASPPEHKDGTALVDLAGWTRSVVVEWVNAADLTQVSGTDTQVKRITVSVQRGDTVDVVVVAIRTSAWPVEDSPVKVLLVVVDADSPSVQDQARVTLMESWGFTVEWISVSSPQADFDAAAATNDVAYICEEIDAAALGVKLRDTTIGVVNEERLLAANFGFMQTYATSTNATVIDIGAVSHYIITPFAQGSLSVFSSGQSVVAIASASPEAPDVIPLATETGTTLKTLLTLETGAELYGGGTAAGRRVQTFYGDDGFDINALTANGQTLMKRSIEWAAGKEDDSTPPPPPPASCGDGLCDPGEDRCNCPVDCGAPPATEVVGVKCQDGKDNDCDGVNDCADSDCAGDPACGACDADGICEAGETCVSCSQDCPSVTNGPPAGRYCCGNGVLESAEGDGTLCDGNP